jgi:hypothetical protein
LVVVGGVDAGVGVVAITSALLVLSPGTGSAVVAGVGGASAAFMPLQTRQLNTIARMEYFMPTILIEVYRTPRISARRVDRYRKKGHPLDDRRGRQYADF